MTKKIMLGHKVRRLRRDQGLTQARMAERLSISPSYLNLIEHNQRPITVDLLLRLAQAFDVDLQSFAQDDSQRLLGALQEVFGDPLFESAGIRRQDIADLASAGPTVAGALISLYQSYRALREDARLLTEHTDQRLDIDMASTFSSGLEEARDFFNGRGYYFDELEQAAEEVWQVGGLEPGNVYRGLVDYLEKELTIRVKLMPSEVMGATRRRYDRHGRRILLSEMVPAASRSFQLAVQVGLIKYRPLLDRLVGEAGFSTDANARIGRIGLANYLAGAVIMPYDRIYRAAQAVRYDIEILQHRFTASFEQICHRLTTLQRPGAKGVPFFMIRVDKAGNVSKRFSAGGLQFARFGGACPRWNVHDAFRWPGRIHTQVSEMPDGQRYFSIAATVNKSGAGYRMPGQVYAIALACEIAHAAQLVYADGVDVHNDDIAVPIGLHCRLCERPACNQRAFPPLHHKLAIDENVHGASLYMFEP